MEISSGKPSFIIPADHPLTLKWKGRLERYRFADPRKDLQWKISHTDILNAIGFTPIHELLMVLQHHPDLIESLVFGIDIRFLAPDGKPYPYQDMSWLDKDHIEWLMVLGSGMVFPLVIYFIQDPRKRYYALMGDMVLRQRFIGKGELEIITDRVFNASRYLLFFCHGTAILPEKYIRQLMTECKVDFPYQKLLEAHEDDMSRGWPLQYKSLHGSKVDACFAIIFGNGYNYM